MSEFRMFILEEAIPYVTSSPPIFFGLAGIVLLYFGWLYNVTKIERPPERIYDYLRGLNLIFGYLALPLLAIFFIQGTIDFEIKSDIILTFIKTLTVVYAYFIISFAKIKGYRYDNSFTFFETDYILAYLKIEPQDILTYLGAGPGKKPNIFGLGFTVIKKFLKLPKIKVIWLLFYFIVFEKLRTLLLMIFSAVIFLSNTSIPIGVFIFSYVFFTLSAYTVDRGISEDRYRYAELYLKESSETEIGRLITMNKDSIRLLIRKDKKLYLQIIPVMNIEKVELRSLQEILTIEKERIESSD